MKEKLIEIGQDKINKAVTEFEGKAIDCLNFLTEHFISTFAEDVDIKLNGYKQDLDNLQNKYYKLEEENKQLRKENEELKAYNKQLDYWKSEYYNSYDEIRNDYNDLKYSQNKIAIEKLEELKYYKHPTNTLCLPSCWVIDKVEKMINELKGGAE